MLSFFSRLYRAIPFHGVRTRLFRIFCFLIRPLRITARVNGISYHLDLGEMIDLALLLRQFEPATTAIFERYVQPGWVVLDIGANIGVHALPLAKLVGPSGRVYAFEPTDYAYRKLTRNISLNTFRNISAWKVALSNETLNQQEVRFQSTWPTIGRPRIAPCRVDFRRLDDWRREQRVDTVQMIKLDVDGHEFPVLDGARELLARCHPLLLMETGTYHFAEPARNPLVLLSRLGYRFFDEKTSAEFAHIDEILRKMNPAGAKEPTTINLLAQVPRSGRAVEAEEKDDEHPLLIQ